jgi:hypothetical protein
MNCNCLTDVEKKLKEKFSADLGAEAKVECQNLGYLFGKSVRFAHLTEFKITADAKGYRKGKRITVTANFCPFCGKSTKEDAPAEGQAEPTSEG